MNKKDATKIIASILKEKDIKLDELTKEALRVAVRCLRGQDKEGKRAV